MNVGVGANLVRTFVVELEHVRRKSMTDEMRSIDGGRLPTKTQGERGRTRNSNLNLRPISFSEVDIDLDGITSGAGERNRRQNDG